MQSFASARASFNLFELVNAKQRLLRSADIASLFDGGVNSIARLQYLAIKLNSFSLYSSFPLFLHNVACLTCRKKKSEDPSSSIKIVPQLRTMKLLAPH